MLHRILPIDFVKAFSWPFRHPTNTVIVRKGKFISPLWPWVAVLPTGKEVAGNIQEDPCTPTCQPVRELAHPAASGWRTEGRGDAPFTAVSGWTSLASAWVVYARCSSGAPDKARCPRWAHALPSCWPNQTAASVLIPRETRSQEGGKEERKGWGRDLANCLGCSRL